MTHKLIQICPKVLVVQEGGYNIDYLGQHASGIVNALLHTTAHSISDSLPHLTPTPADLDVGIKSVTQVEAAKAKEWAVRNVEETREAVRAGWKCLQGE